jgi:hypothetical protein
MELQKLPQQAIIAARLRKMARQLDLEAEALEAITPNQQHKKHVEFLHTKEKRDEWKANRRGAK